MQDTPAEGTLLWGNLVETFPTERVSHKSQISPGVFDMFVLTTFLSAMNVIRVGACCLSVVFGELSLQVSLFE